MESCVQIPLDKPLLDHLVREAKDFAYSHGFVLRSVDQPSSSEYVIHAPMTLFPTTIPDHCFQKAKDVQTHFNLLMHKVAHDHEFLTDCLRNAVKVDDFTRHLWEIYEKVRNEGVAQPVCLAMNRNDFMLNCGKATDKLLKSKENLDLKTISIKQIEFNTMASSFGGLAQQLSLGHQYILTEMGHHSKTQKLPGNRAVEGLAEAVKVAWEKYGNTKAVFLELVLSVERNIYDQRHLEYAIRAQDPRIRVIRRSLEDIRLRGSLNSERCLIIDDYEVAIVYQRSCYSPDHFKSEEDWKARLMVEHSRAIKCPSIHYHLAGTKKVQQVLAQPGVLERFMEDPGVVQEIRDTFVGLYSLDMDSEGDSAIEEAMRDPYRFVLKPQREGGGNNTYGDGIPKLLKSIGQSSERSAYILMERVYPPPCFNYAIRAGQEVIDPLPLVTELGIYGSLVGTKDEIFHNKQDGHLLRSKSLDTDEGGVATGFAVLDTPYLV